MIEVLTSLLQKINTLPLGIHYTLAITLGALVGSFLNVIIHRLPEQLHYQWSQQSFEWLNKTPYQQKAPAGISFPASHCPQCKKALAFYHNIPLLSYVMLRGKCAFCATKIRPRYFCVELLSAILCGFLIYRFGWSAQAFAAMLLTWVLISLSYIDAQHKLLPDIIVLPTLWIGLALSLVPVFIQSKEAILGAILGYGIFWSVFKLYELATKKQGMGYGDFKLLSLLGAWLGWQMLPQIILIASAIGSIIGIIMILKRRNTSQEMIPFGPYLAIAGWVSLVYGEALNTMYLSSYA